MITTLERSKMLRLGVDIMGFDHHPKVALDGCWKFLQHFPAVKLLLIGNQQLVNDHPLLRQTRVSFLHTEEFISSDDQPLSARCKTTTSMYLLVQQLARARVDGIISAGNTAVYMSLALSKIKPLPELVKPSLLVNLPHLKNGVTSLLDVGANLELTGWQLYQCAKMAHFYQQLVLQISRPKIHLINIGVEKNKGKLAVQTAAELLVNDETLNYQGYLEPRYLLEGNCDVAVVDGYGGNLILKTMEGSLKALAHAFKHEYRKPWNWPAALLSMRVFKRVKQRFDYQNYAGGIIFGLRKPVVKTHGSANALQFASGLRILYELSQKHVLDKIRF